MMSKIRFKNSRGFSLIEIMVSMGLVAILALVVFSLNNFMNKGKLSSDTSFQADQFRKQIVALLNNPTAWRNTLVNNSTFDCIRNSTDCATALNNAVNNGPPPNTYSYSTLVNGNGACAAGVCYGGFSVFDANNNNFYPFASKPARGFQMNGAQCDVNMANGVTATGAPGWSGVASGNTSVGSSARSSACPFRLVLWWVPICPATTGTCFAPQVHVKGYVLYTPAPGDPVGLSAFKPSNYGIDMILPPKYQ